MPYSDEEKLEEIKKVFNKKFNSIQTWADFKTMIGQINKTNVKNFVKSNLQRFNQDDGDLIDNRTNRKANRSDLITEVDNI